MRALLVGGFVASTLVGCISVNSVLQRESARAINPTPYPDSVTISDVKRWGSEWVATTSGGVYDCSKHQGEDRALCVKRQTSP